MRFVLFRNRHFYGRTLVEGIQSPGETVYVPHYVHHAVYNLGEVVSVGDNPFYSSGIEEAAFQIYKNYNSSKLFLLPWVYSNGSEPFVHKGKYHPRYI